MRNSVQTPIMMELWRQESQAILDHLNSQSDQSSSKFPQEVQKADTVSVNSIINLQTFDKPTPSMKNLGSLGHSDNTSIRTFENERKSRYGLPNLSTAPVTNTILNP